VESASLVERDRAVCWHPYTQHALEPEPLPVAGARGTRIVLEDGRELLDAISSWWTVLHGHAEPHLLEAMHAQAARLDHVLFAGATHEPAVALAEALVRVAPHGLARVFFSDDGSTAVEIALKMVVQRWHARGEHERRVFVCLEGAYHGDTFGAMAVGDPEPFFRAFRPLLFEVRRARADAADLERVLTELGPRAAGVIVEPLVQGAGGMRMHSPEFLASARELCDRHALPLVADEVLTGFGRTGTLFACERAGIAPDVLCLAKGLSGGLFPIAATLATEEIYASFFSTERSRAFFHGHTFTAHPVGCAVALASLELALENDLPARFEHIGQCIARALEPLRENPSVHSLRRQGGIVAFDLRAPRGAASGYLSALAPHLRQAAIERGVLLRPLGDVLYAMPPARATDAECQEIAGVLIELADEARRALGEPRH
jgi:adenosylmethionine-8-amino-7-oxononanoate aminotransferase